MPAPYPRPNTQPIYPYRKFTFNAVITNQRGGPDTITANSLGIPPIKLGTIGETGGVIYRMGFHLPNKDGANQILYFYRQKEGDVFYYPHYQWFLVPNTVYVEAALPINNLTERRCLDYGANETIYAAVDSNINVVITAEGAHYS